MELEFTLSAVKVLHERTTYGILDVLGDFGGVKEVFDLAWSNFYAPIIGHMFLTKAIQNLYYAKTREKNLFKGKASERSQKKA
jgi:hypothetical protein